MTRRAVATFGSGPARELLDISLDSFSIYARTHGYELVVGDGESHGRPPAWGKVLLLQDLLQRFDAVLWLDADTLVLDPSIDIDSVVPDTAFQAMTNCVLNEAERSPCTGVWFLRAGDRARAFLEAVWAMGQVTEHMWEQAAVMTLLGWSIDRPLQQIDPGAPWLDGTHWLAETWDMLITYQIGFAPGFIRHYAGTSHEDRLRLMRADWLKARCGLLGRPLAAARALAARASWRAPADRKAVAIRHELSLLLSPRLRSRLVHARDLFRD